MEIQEGGIFPGAKTEFLFFCIILIKYAHTIIVKNFRIKIYCSTDLYLYKYILLPQMYNVD